MSETKATRLGKAAKELGVSTGTIIDFLAKKGEKIEDSPMAKIEGPAYDLLLAEFAGDKAAKEKTADTTAKVRESRSTITLEDSRKSRTGEKDEEEPEIDYSRFKRKVEVKEKPVAPPKPEPAPVAEVPAPVEPAETEEKVAAKKTVKKKEEPEVVAPEPEEKTNEVKVVGKIDLDAFEKPKSKGKKKKEETPVVEEPASKKKSPKAKEVEIPVEPIVEKTVQPEEEKAPEREPEKELIRVKVEKLSGVKVMGKIELPTEAEKKKPEPQKPGGQQEEKRKRKRVGKVDIQRQQEIDRRQQRTTKPAEPKKTELSEQDIQNQVKATLARLGGMGKSKSSKLRREKRDFVARRNEEEMQRQQAESSVLKLTEFVTVSELASMMNKQPTEIIKVCMQLGIFASLNQRLDAETIHIISEEFGFEVQFVSADLTEQIQEEVDSPEDMITRPPVVTVMGHVDHGKTSLLDFIRKANVIAGEAGGITQHIGAYSVELPNGRKITFLDTPGHEAFTAMRARGAQVTDLAIIVIAADDSVMPQTKEAISHAQAAGVPMIFALNKVDKPDANPDKIREQLSAMNILVEEWGGKFQSQEISAKKGMNVDLLLEKVLLEADLLDLKANPKKRAVGTVIESALDKGRGYVTTLLVEGGTLRVGDPILAGHNSGRVKAMFNERGQKVNEAGPATPVSLLGFEGAPNAGDKFNVMEDEREARNIALKRQQLQREQSLRTKKHLTIEEIGRRIALGDFKELNLIVKGDVDGSVEALTDSLQKLSTEKIQVRIIHKGVGQISESDVLLASASDAIIIGFQVRPSHPARKLAENEEIQIKLYSVIYKAIEEVKEAMEGMLSARIEEQVIGTAEIREVFRISKVGTIAGCMVLDGKINRQSKVRVIRDGIVIFTGELGSLKRFKDDVKEVVKGYECGLNVEKFNNIEVGDNIEAFEEVEVKQTL
ncbi:MAG: translation initiation factor IF-2 [Flavobacteriales bacterium]|nr:translation initiation factor IF-2 [Flavobacteriales bacterium]